MFSEDVRTTLGVVDRLSDLFRSAKADSIIEYTKGTRVEPIVMLESNLAHQEYMTDIMQTLTSMFTGYYLQAVAVSVNVGKVNTIKLLDKFSTDRSPTDAVLNSSYLGLISNEDYAFKLPDYSASTESIGETISRVIGGRDDEQEERGRSGSGRDATKTVGEASNLAVGKLFDVVISDGPHEATITMAVRMNVKQIATRDLTHILSLGVKDNSAKERFHRWRAGELDFMKDLILCQDIIDAHKDTSINDKTGVYQTMLKRRKNNRLSSILSGNPSVNTASGIAVISADTVKKLEKELGIKLSSFRKREKLFKETFLMILVVVDTEWEQVTIYNRSIDSETELSVRDLKNVNKGSGPDVTDILKAYQLSNSPTL